jgi:riboflavin biosynthesis pyrimidine reductase
LKDLGVRVYGHDVMDVSDDEDLQIAVGDVMRDDLKLAEVLVEPGPSLAAQFFSTGWVDRLWVIRSPRSIGDPTAPSAMPVPESFVRTGSLNLAGDTLTEYLNPASPVFFAAEPSADFVLASESSGQ